MKTRTKIWLAVAGCLFILGTVLLVAGLAASNWDFSGLSTQSMETNRYELTADFRDISLTTVTADVSFLPAPDGKAAVICREDEKMKHTVTVQNGTLTIEIKDTREWYDHIGIFSSRSSITVYLPAAQYKTLDIQVVTGDVRLETLSCRALRIDSVTGDITMKNVIAADSLDIEATTGDVSFEACDAASITIALTTGDVTGSLLSGKDFSVEVTTGDVSVPPSGGSGKCRITATTGDVHITVS